MRPLSLARAAAVCLALCVVALAGPAEAGRRAAEPGAGWRLWTPVAQQTSLLPLSARGGRYALDLEALDALLAHVPLENTRQAARSPVTLRVPLADGRMAAFRVEESPIMAPDLARRHPAIRTYAGRALDGSGSRLRFSRTPLGFQAIVLTGDSADFVEPVALGETRVYRAYHLRDVAVQPFECSTPAAPPAAQRLVETEVTSSGPTLRTYRLAVAATGEYTQFFGSQANALAGIAATVNNVNAIYNRDVSVRLVLIANEDQIVYTNPATDPFPLANLNAEVQAAIDSTIGDANYDVGHVFHASGFSGNAGCIACVCSSGSKGSGYSMDATPNDGDFTFLVSHEMGHQHGGTHTFNGSNCNPGQYTGSSAWEPGSGSTIMSYSSICGADNVLGSQVGDLYFHAGSRGLIVGYTGSGGGTSCGTTSGTGNNAPGVNAGADFTIPRGTPFVLTASGSDPDGDPLTWTWEELDLGPTAPLSAVDDGQIPLFRSRPPSSSSARTFPLFSDLLAGAPNLFPNKLGEQLPSTDRTMVFRATGRDNRSGGGGVNDDEMVITVSGSPFEVTSPSTADPLECGVSNLVTWNVGGGSVAPTVDIRLSTNGGTSFPALLAGGTANDGSESVPVPASSVAGAARVRIDSVGNVFFNISEPTQVLDTLDPVPTCPAPAVVECSATGGTPAGDPQLAPFFAGFSATDACDPTPTLTNNAPPFFPLGGTSVTFTATDDSGNDASCSAGVTVQDTLPPLITCPASVTVECTGHDCKFSKDDPQLAAFFAAAGASDVCDAAPVLSNNAPDCFVLGANVVTFTATDASGNAASCTAVVNVVDTTPPVISVSISPDQLWPPNHKLVPIAVQVTVTDVCDPSPTFVLTSITSDEPDNGPGDGNTTQDIQGAEYGTADTAFLLRAERSGRGDGRVYTIVYTASDASGNTAQGVVHVTVPHDRGN